MTAVRALIFTIMIPGTVAVYIPHWLAQNYPEQISIGPLHYLSLPLMLAGLLLYLASVIAFVIQGGGTPAIWFTKPLKFLIGEEPGKLVSTSLYRYSRNPMYAGVVSFVVGQGLWWELKILFIYAGVLWLCFHLVVVFIEEPHLRRKMGVGYDEYCRRVPRWIGFRRG